MDAWISSKEFWSSPPLPPPAAVAPPPPWRAVEPSAEDDDAPPIPKARCKGGTGKRGRFLPLVFGGGRGGGGGGGANDPAGPLLSAFLREGRLEGERLRDVVVDGDSSSPFVGRPCGACRGGGGGCLEARRVSEETEAAGRCGASPSGGDVVVVVVHDGRRLRLTFGCLCGGNRGRGAGV